jgi:hypothetical protein
MRNRFWFRRNPQIGVIATAKHHPIACANNCSGGTKRSFLLLEEGFQILLTSTDQPISRAINSVKSIGKP